VSSKLFLEHEDVRLLLSEGRTLYYSERGSRKDPRFPSPVRRPGRRDVYYRPHVEEFARRVAEELPEPGGDDDAR